MSFCCHYCDHRWGGAPARRGAVYRCPACRKLSVELPRNADGRTELGRYELIEEVGQGTNAVVCRAVQQPEGTVVAVKLFLSTVALDEHSRKEFVRERELATDIQHPNVVRVFEGGNLAGIPYLVMEYVDGIDMAQYLLQQGPVDQYLGLTIGQQACEALDYVWSTYLMVHRDIKPQNLMLTNDGTVKVCDFGMVVPHEQALVDLEAVEGTPYYVSPETITEGAYQDNRSDLYALGATLYHLIAGVPPFEGDTVLAVVEARLKQPPPDLCQTLPDADPAVAQVLLTMMAPDPEDRYVTAAECGEDMARVLVGKKPRLVDRGRRKVNQ